MAAVSLEAGKHRPRLTRLAQSGAAKAMLPRVHGAAPEIVFLNTAGGLTAGDRLDYAVTLGAGMSAVATTQTAERGYSSLAAMDPARLTVDLQVDEGGYLSWLPQETILFEGAALDRTTRIDLAEGASCLMCETVVLGRAAMGETLETLRFSDRREITRAGRPVMLEPFALSTNDLAHRGNPATLGGARAFASVVFVDRDAETRLDPLRRLLETAPAGVEAAASAWDGRLVARFLARDGHPLRRALGQVLGQLGGKLPRVWQI